MESIIWILALVVVGIVAWRLGAARSRGRGASAERTGAFPESTASATASTSGSRPVREARSSEPAGATGSAGRMTEGTGAPGPQRVDATDLIEKTLERIRRYLEGGVEQPLREAVGDGKQDRRHGAEDALMALEDLYFYLRPIPEDRSTEDLNVLAKEAGDEYRQEWDVDVDVHVPERATVVEVNRESFLDALYLVLHNAGTFGEAKDIEVVVRYQDGECWLVVRDRGPGFDDEALRRAFEPLYTTADSALGLGLYQARRILGAMGGTLAIRNRPRGGAQVEIVLPGASD